MADHIQAITIGGSAGSIKVITEILSGLPAIQIPIFLVLHRHKTSGKDVADYFNKLTEMNVKEGEDKEPVKSNTIYLAPSNYHMTVDEDKLISLSVDAPVKYAIPSIDVTFESIASVYKENVLAILLTGANEDGTNGLIIVKEYGGICIVQDPNEAENPVMPNSAIDGVQIDSICSIEEIKRYLWDLRKYKNEK
jgi:two-component system, chemotaxis family, protein-glutamate methylesterase/glutaminase